MQIKASSHPFLRSERQLSLLQHMLQTMNVERLVAFHTDKVVPVSLMVPKEKVLAMRRLRDIPPIRQALLHRAQCRMLVQLIFNIIGLQEALHFAPQPATFQFIDFHLRLCFGRKFRHFFGYGSTDRERNPPLPELYTKEVLLEDILDFHQRYESIHPFQDCNGRVGCLIMFKECLNNDIVPFIITDELKMFYYRGLHEWKTIPGYLADTCLTVLGHYKKLVDCFRIKY